ncbi:MAG: response regulator [Nanoarchaeota archaeon]
MEKKDITVLIIEDDDSPAGVFRTVVDRLGFKTELAMTEKEGIDLILKKPEIVLSDTYCNGLPYGPNIVKKARSLGHKPRIIANSGDSKGQDEWKSLEPDYFFRKPVEIAELRNALNDLYETIKKERESKA